MYHEFRENGSAAFRPDTSGALLSEDVLLTATSSRAIDSSAGGPHADDDMAIGNMPQASQQPHAEQGNAHLEGISHNSSVMDQSDAATAASRASVGLGSVGSSSTEQGWPPDIQWLPVNPLVSAQSCIFC